MARTDRSSWERLWSELQASGEPGSWHSRLITAYGEPGRHYHNLQHIAECLSEFDLVRTSLAQPAAVETALWFHDVVYDPHSATNEEDSANVAAQCLRAAGVKNEMTNLVEKLILATKRHEAGSDQDAVVLIDIDLAILGQPATRYWEYEQAIRAEYAWVPAITFAAKRSEILQHFLDRPMIFRTESFQARYEAPARANLSAALRRLDEALS